MSKQVKNTLPIIYCKTTGINGWRELTEEYVFAGVKVPTGTKWNGSSTPWFAKWLLPKFENTLEASCVHDYLCHNAKTKADRKAADKLFKEMLKQKKLGKIRYRAGYLGVRIGAQFNINGSKASWE